MTATIFSIQLITLHYTTLHYTTLHYTTLHYTTLLHTTLHYTTLHYTTLHYTTLHYTTLHYTTPHTYWYTSTHLSTNVVGFPVFLSIEYGLERKASDGQFVIPSKERPSKKDGKL